MTNDAAATSLDRFLGGRLVVEQPAQGYRAAIDPIFLAAAVAAQAGQSAFEAGAGTGVASLCLAARVPGLAITALEAEEAAAGLMAANLRRNDAGGEITLTPGDLFGAVPSHLHDLAFSNPPFFERGSESANPGKARAHHLGAGGLGTWLGAMMKWLKPKGTLTVILPADALDRALVALQDQAGAIVIFPLWPKPGRPAKRILIEARKASRKPMVLAAGLVLHQENGAYTAEADAILREGCALKIS